MALRHLKNNFTVVWQLKRVDLRPIHGRVDPDLGGRRSQTERERRDASSVPSDGGTAAVLRPRLGGDSFLHGFGAANHEPLISRKRVMSRH